MSPHPTASEQLRHAVAKGWLVHCFTGLGALCGMFGLISVADYDFRGAIIWLVVATVLDGLDGTAARAWNVAENIPRIDGYALDLIIDYVTCIVIPVLFMHRFHMLPDGWSLAIGSFVLFISALWMSRTDQMTEDDCFNGFPGEWNILVPTLFLAKVGPWITAVVCVALAVTQLTNWTFLHPVRVRRFRWITVPVVSVWLLTIILMTVDLPTHNVVGRVIVMTAAFYVFGMGTWRSISGSWLPADVEARKAAVAARAA